MEGFLSWASGVEPSGQAPVSDIAHACQGLHTAFGSGGVLCNALHLWKVSLS